MDIYTKIGLICMIIAAGLLIFKSTMPHHYRYFRDEFYENIGRIIMMAVIFVVTFLIVLIARA